MRTMNSSVPECAPCCKESIHVPDQSWGLNGYPLAMVYAVNQPFQNLYSVEEALKNGTLFQELNLPLESVQKSCVTERRCCE